MVFELALRAPGLATLPDASGPAPAGLHAGDHRAQRDRAHRRAAVLQDARQTRLRPPPSPAEQRHGGRAAAGRARIARSAPPRPGWTAPTAASATSTSRLPRRVRVPPQPLRHPDGRLPDAPRPRRAARTHDLPPDHAPERRLRPPWSEPDMHHTSCSTTPICQRLRHPAVSSATRDVSGFPTASENRRPSPRSR